MDRTEAIAAKLRGKRAEAAMSQEAVAEIVGLTSSTLSRIEKAESGLRIDTAWELADLYDCTLDELVGRQRSRKDG